MTANSTEADTGRRLRALEEAVFNLQRERQLLGSTLDNVATGTVAGFLTDNFPPGWLPLDGTVVTASGYPALYAYLTANGLSTTLPDYRDRFPVGAGNLYNGTSSGGSANAVVVSHTHTTGHASTLPEASGLGLTVTTTFQDRVRVNRASGVGTGDVSDSTGVTGTNANLPPYRGLYWMIRT